MNLEGAADSASRFADYVERLTSVIGHADRAKPLNDYCTGLLATDGRRSVEPMAAITAPAEVSAQHQRLLHFVADAPWSDEPVLAKVREMVVPVIEGHGPIEAWIIDDTSFPKCGSKSVGVLDGADQVGIALDVEDCLPELGVHLVHGLKRVVLEDFFADFIPEIFLRIEFGRIRRKVQQRDVVGNRKVAAAVVGGAVEDQQDVLPRKLTREDLKEYLEAFGIRGWHDQIDASAILGRDRTVQIDVFADELGGDTGPYARRRPARPQSIHSAETRLISEHDA